MICVCYKHCAVTHTFPLSPISSNGNNSVTNKQRRVFFFCGISIVGGWWFFLCIVLETASLGNWESQTADEMSPHELSPQFHTLTNSHVGDLTHTLPLKHSPFSPHTHTHTILRISHQLLVKLNGTQRCLNRLQLLTCCLSRLVTFDRIMSDMQVS